MILSTNDGSLDRLRRNRDSLLDVDAARLTGPLCDAALNPVFRDRFKHLGGVT